MAHFHIKRKKGRPYLYVREIARVGGKPKVVNQVYVGSPERVAALAGGESQEDTKLKVEEFGALWVANQMDKDVDLAGIIDEIVPGANKEKGPSVGEFFLYGVLNRMLDPKSKNAIAEWFKQTAVQQIRPVDVGELTSRRYWEKWSRVDADQLERIARKFFEKVCEIESPSADALLFDTTNYYTFMASDTESELAKRGNNKAGRHHLRQVGLALLVSRDKRLPMYYRVYPGNVHDSKLFGQLMDEMFGVIISLNKTKDRLTLVIDKGMNGEDNYAVIDEHPRIHFVTTYSTYFADDLAATSIDQFEPIDIEHNRRLLERDADDERLLAYRTTGEYWGKSRAVVVTHNPATARKQAYTLKNKLEIIRQHLLEMRAKVRERARQWRKPDDINERYLRLCERLHVPSDLYHVEFARENKQLVMSFRKDSYRIERKMSTFGRNIIITDNTDWTTADIVQASLDRWHVEDRFRQSKDHNYVATMPIRHWTDNKIRCHLFTCVVAMTYLRRLELRLEASGIKTTAPAVMDQMRQLHSVLSIKDARSKPRRRIETPTKTQAEVLSALDYAVDPSGVLRPSC